MILSEQPAPQQEVGNYESADGPHDQLGMGPGVGASVVLKAILLIRE